MLATITTYNRRRGWGFALPDESRKAEIFIHRSNLPMGVAPLEGDRIEYDAGERNGRPVALNIRIVAEAPTVQVIEPTERV